MGDVVELKPREIISKIGKHKLIMLYDPARDVDHRWSWRLTVEQTFNYSGMCQTPALCRVHASEYAFYHDTEITNNG